MKKNKNVSRRDFLKLASLSTAGVILASCAPQTAATPTSGPAAAPTTASTKQITLNVSTHTYKPWNDMFTKQFATYMGQHPNVKINYSLVSDTNGDTETLTRLQAGTGADIFHMINTFSAIVAQGYAVPAPSDIADEAKSKCTPLAYQSALYNGKLYALTDNISIRLAIYNSDIMNAHGVTKLPETWDEVTALSEKFLVKSGSTVTQALLQLGWDPYAEWFPAMLWNYGANLWNADVTALALEEPQSITVAKLWQDNTHPDLGYYGDAFVGKKVAMVATGPFYKPYLKTGAPDIKPVSALMPGGPSGRNTGAMVNWFFVNSKASADVQAVAWDLLKYLALTPETQKDWMSLGFLPTHTDLLNSDTVQKDDWLKPFADALAISKADIPVSCVGWAYVQPIVQDEVTRLGAGDLTPEQFVKELRDKGTAQLKKQGCKA